MVYGKRLIRYLQKKQVEGTGKEILDYKESSKKERNPNNGE